MLELCEWVVRTGEHEDLQLTALKNAVGRELSSSRNVISW